MSSLTYAVIGLALSIGGLVWRASRLATSLENVVERLRQLSKDLEHAETALGELRTTVAILQERTPPHGTPVRHRSRPRLPPRDDDEES